MRTFLAAGILVVLACSAHDAHGAAQRTFVASTGSDANGCSLTAPCRTFAAALGKTNAGGEIVVLDSAGYGTIVIDKSVTITAPDGVYAGISVFSGLGVEIAGADIDVTLRGLTVTGQGGNRGIVVTEGRSLVVDRCTVSGLTSDVGINVAFGRASIVHSLIERNAIGIRLQDADAAVADNTLSFNGTGVEILACAGSTRHVSIERNVIHQGGIFVYPSEVGSVAALVSRNEIIGAVVCLGVSGASAARSPSNVYASDNRMSGCGWGVIQSDAAVAVLAGNTIVDNATGVHVSTPGNVSTLKSNVIQGNGQNIAGGPLPSLSFD